MIDIMSLVNKHEGKLGFVVGAGPSLHKTNTSLLKDYVTIAVNSAVSKVRDCTYFLADDWAVDLWNYYRDILPGLGCTSLLYESKLKARIKRLDPERVCLFPHKTWYDPSENKHHEDGLVMTKGPPIIGARTAAGSAVHFLYLMGCDPIVLLGCDCCYEGDKRYYWQFEGEEKCFTYGNFPIYSKPNAGVVDGKPVDTHSIEFLDYWKALSIQADKQGITILSSSGGLLDAFPKKALEDVIETYGDRKKDL